MSVELGVDPRVVRVCHPGEQRCRTGQPAGRAVTALQGASLEPRLLHRVQDAVLGEALSSRDALADSHFRLQQRSGVARGGVGAMVVRRDRRRIDNT